MAEADATYYSCGAATTDTTAGQSSCAVTWVQRPRYETESVLAVAECKPQGQLTTTNTK